jgi:valine--pyruvate aminotransferase
MFCWLWIDEPWFDDLACYTELKRQQVFIVPGRHFFVPPEPGRPADPHATKCIRLSLSAEEPVIAEAITRIATTLELLRRAS